MTDCHKERLGYRARVLRVPAVLLVLLVIGAALAGSARGHAPTTGIGRAVTAFEDVPVSYDPGSALTELEAEIPLRMGAGDRLHVALLPASASAELPGPPDAVAAEIAREAGLQGTLVVLVGRHFGGWSDELAQDRIDALIADATRSGGASAVELRDVLAAVAASPKDGSDTPWGWIAAAVTGFVLAALALAGQRARR